MPRIATKKMVAVGLHPERAHHAPAVGDAQRGDPQQPQQDAGQHVAQPVRAQVQAREAQQRHRQRRDHVGPGAPPPRQLAGDQHGEEAVDHRGHRHRGRREAEARHGGGGRRLGHVQHVAQDPGEEQREGRRRQPVPRGDVPRAATTARRTRPAPPGASTAASPSVASSAIGMSASGLRRPNMAWCTDEVELRRRTAAAHRDQDAGRSPSPPPPAPRPAAAATPTRGGWGRSALRNTCPAPDAGATTPARARSCRWCARPASARGRRPWPRSAPSAPAPRRSPPPAARPRPTPAPATCRTPSPAPGRWPTRSPPRIALAGMYWRSFILSMPAMAGTNGRMAPT